VTHFSRLSKIVIDVPPQVHDAELAFWQEVTGEQLVHYTRYPEYHGGRLHGEDLGLLVQRLDHGEARVHVDIHTDDLDAEVTRLERAGAERVQQIHQWWVMRDPAGILFCVIPEEPGTLTETNAWRWD
jgi:hypothetical protein